MYNNQFSALDNVKMTCQTHNTKVSFEITIRKRHAYIDIPWPCIWNQYFYLGIWNDDRSFAFIWAPYTMKVTEHKGKCVY